MAFYNAIATKPLVVNMEELAEAVSGIGANVVFATGNDVYRQC